MKNFLMILSVFYCLLNSAICTIKHADQKSEHFLNNVKLINQENDVEYSPSEERLLKYLFKSYNPHIMPRVNYNESLKLYFGLALGQLINVVRFKKKKEVYSY